jgi:hypothetical protein
MFKKSAICIAVGVLSLGVHAETAANPAVDSSQQFLTGFSWGSTGGVQDICDTTHDDQCETEIGQESSL